MGLLPDDVGALDIARLGAITAEWNRLQGAEEAPEISDDDYLDIVRKDRNK